MIYQKDHELIPFPWGAQVDNSEHDYLLSHYYVIEQDEFERGLRERIARHLSTPEGPVDPEDVELPAIEYAEVVLTQEQAGRLAEVNTVGGLALRDALPYVAEGVMDDETVSLRFFAATALRDMAVAQSELMIEAIAQGQIMSETEIGALEMMEGPDYAT